MTSLHPPASLSPAILTATVSTSCSELPLAGDHCTTSFTINIALYVDCLGSQLKHAYMCFYRRVSTLAVPHLSLRLHEGAHTCCGRHSQYSCELLASGVPGVALHGL